jgi:hypothetical protein
MDRKFSDLDKDTAEHLGSILEAQTKTSFNAIVETDKWLTQHNFLVNAGGAAAVLSYLSSDTPPTFAVIPLTIFLLGVIASGIEIRYLMKIHSELHEDAIRRRSGFVSNIFSIAQSADVQAPKTITKKINHYSGLVAQASFIVGCVVGIWGLLCP